MERANALLEKVAIVDRQYSSADLLLEKIKSILGVYYRARPLVRVEEDKTAYCAALKEKYNK